MELGFMEHTAVHTRLSVLSTNILMEPLRLTPISMIVANDRLPLNLYKIAVLLLLSQGTLPSITDLLLKSNHHSLLPLANTQ
jgi:hypothetical protein